MANLTVFAIALLVLSVPLAVTAGDSTAIDLKTAQAYFEEARVQCHLDGGALWGKSLCVPIAFIDPQSREVITNQPDSAGEFTECNGVWTSIWPRELAAANFVGLMNGTRWTTVMWPPPTDKTARVALLLHESFHNIQESIGFPANSPANPHLDSRDGRIWLRLEWRALKAALLSPPEGRPAAVRDALIFRACRHEMFPGAAESEQAMEMHEGLAEYTGVKLCGLPDDRARQYLVEVLHEVRSNVPSFVNTFAYWSGPAYGFLLDILQPHWRTGLTPKKNLGNILQESLKIELPDDLEAAAQERMIAYDGSNVVAEETGREQKQIALLAGYRARLVSGPVLVLPLQQMQIQYDPRTMTPLDSHGTVYATLRVSDVWGILDAKGEGALLSSDWRAVRVPVPNDSEARPLVGDGWTLELNEGWKVVPSEREGDYTLAHEG